MQKLPIELCVFDLDGTLVDSGDDIAAAVNQVLARMKRAPLAAGDIVGFVGDGLRALLERALGTQDPAALEKAAGLFGAYYTAHLLDSTRLYPGAASALRALSSKKLAVASNKPTEFVTRILDGLGIASCFCEVLGGDPPFSKKPSPDQIVAIMRRTECLASATLVVGDSRNDVLAARAAGAYSCYCLAGFNRGRDLKGVTPHYTISTLKELPALIA